MYRTTLNKEIDRLSRIDPHPMHGRTAEPIVLGAALNMINDKIPGPMPGITTDRGFAEHANMAGSISTIVLSLKSSLAGIIIGKGGANSKEIMQISKADLQVQAPPEDPSLCIVRITGTFEQTNIALRLVHQKVECKFFSRGCRNGDNCKFYHGLLQA